MKTGVIRISAAMLGCILLLFGAAGCARLDGPSRGGEIRFRAEPSLLHDDATKSAEPKDGASFAVRDAFKVFGRRDSENDPPVLLFNNGAGSVVTKQSGGNWTYSPVEKWDWTGTQSDHYEFVGIYPVTTPGEDERYSQIVTYPGNIAVSTPYDVSAGDNFDLMAATWFRDGREPSVLQAVVPMTFYHMTSAVNVEIENNSHARKVRIHSIKFKYITVSGNAFVTMTEQNDPVRSWNDIERSMDSDGVSEVIPAEEDRDLAHNGSYTKGWDMMIPQRLDQEPTLLDPRANPADFLPKLCISYTPFDGAAPGEGDTRVDAEIVLKDIRRSERDGGEPITQWVAGQKYNYYVSMRLDGGLLVELITTDWDVVMAHTWGLML